MVDEIRRFHQLLVNSPLGKVVGPGTVVGEMTTLRQLVEGEGREPSVFGLAEPSQFQVGSGRRSSSQAGAASFPRHST